MWRLAVPTLLAVLCAPQAAAQSPEPPTLTIGYERSRDRYHYRFENPSSVDTSELVPHEFTQTYWGDNQWFVVRGSFRVHSRPFDTEIGATPQRRTRGDDYDTFFQPSGDVVVVGTTGGVSLRSWKIRQTVGLGRRSGIDWYLGYQYRGDRAIFHPGLKSISHTQPPSYEEFWVYTRETTVSRTYGADLRLGRSWRAGRWRVNLETRVAPLMTGRLTILLPDKYPGQTLVFNATYASIEPKVAVAIGQRWPIALTAGYSHAFSYRQSRQFACSAATIGVAIGRRARAIPDERTLQVSAR